MPRRKDDPPAVDEHDEAVEAVDAEERDPIGEDDRLPWLEAVEEDEETAGPSAAKLIAFVVIGLVAIALVVGGLFWIGNREPADGEPELIAAPEGDYKVKPDDPGGMQVEGEGKTAFAASEGVEPKGSINVDAVPEEPLLKAPPATNAPSDAASKAPAPPAPKQAPAAPAASAGGATIQLGAFSSSAAATSAWKALAGRFSYLAPLSHSVIPVTSGGRTLYRLRASGPDAASLCGRLRVAGESCVTIG